MNEAFDRIRSGMVFRALLAIFAIAALLATANPQGVTALEDDSSDMAGSLISGGMRAQEAVESQVADDANEGALPYTFARTLQSPDSSLYPAGIAFDQEGKVYVVAAGNDRIDIYAGNGSFLESWGDTGTKPGDFKFHDASEGWNYGDIAFDDDGNSYVADPGNHRVQMFDHDRDYVRSIQISTFPQSETVREKIGYEDLTLTPAGLAVDDAADRLYIADAVSDTVKIYHLNGTFLAEWGMFGTGTHEFGDLFDIAVAKDGSIWVPDFGSSTVYHFSATGEQLGTGGSHGQGAGQFMGAASVAVDNIGNLYVTDYLEGDVQVISNDGKFSTVLDSEFGTPTYVSVSDDGSIWVSYENNNTVVRWTTWEAPKVRILVE